MIYFTCLQLSAEDPSVAMNNKKGNSSNIGKKLNFEDYNLAECPMVSIIIFFFKISKNLHIVGRTFETREEKV